MRKLSIGAMLALLIAVYAKICAAGETFASAEEASRALYQAVRDDNEDALARILGAGNELVSSEDPLQERRDREQFARKYDQMHRLAREPGGGTILYIGAENWPFPFPLVEENAAWHFDADAGMEEVLARRIGKNELAAITTSRALLQPQTSGALPVNAGNDDRAVAFDGYYFRRLQGRETVIAYPAEYGATGIMTFLADSKDGVREKDLGPGTAELARNIKKMDSSSTWHRVE